MEFSMESKSANEKNYKKIQPYAGLQTKPTYKNLVDVAMGFDYKLYPMDMLRVSSNVDGRYSCGFTRGITSSDRLSKQIAKEKSEYDYIKEEDFRESDNGVVSSGGDVIANGCVRIESCITVNGCGNQSTIILGCVVYCVATGFEGGFFINKESFSEVYKYIKREYPNIYMRPHTNDIMVRYSSCVYTKYKKNWKNYTVDLDGGWFEDGDAFYYNRRNYDKKILEVIGNRFSGYISPPILDYDFSLDDTRWKIFSAGARFLEVGNYNKEISTMFLFSHMGFFMFFLEKIGIPCHFLLYVYGVSNSLKTAVTSCLVNVFENDTNKRMMRGSSTKASAYEYIYRQQDNSGGFDDVSNTERSSQNQNMEIFESIARVTGDGNIPGKMNSYGGVCHRKSRCAVIFTGETEFEMAKSSVLRVLMLAVNKGSFDGDRLFLYQRKPEIMQQYFSMFIKFLEEYGKKLIYGNEEKIYELRKKYRDKYEPRHVDMIVVFNLLIDAWGKYGVWACEDRGKIEKMQSLLRESILNIIQSNSDKCKLSEPSIRFIYGLIQILNSDSRMKIAENEDIYIQNESLYIGFWDKTSDKKLWLNFNLIYKAVKMFWSGMEMDFMSTSIQIKESLNNEGLIKTAKNSKGGTDYVIKQRKGRRSRMLVLFYDKCMEKLEEARL